MILTGLINIVFDVITWLLNLLNIPDTPQWVLDADAYLNGVVDQGISLCAYWFGADVWNAATAVIGLLLIIDFTYPVIIWVIHKLPVSVT